MNPDHSHQKNLAILGIMLGLLTMGLSFSLINANLETIHRELHASIIQLQWMINVYGIFIASTLVAMGRLGDIHGRKKLYLLGMVLFAIAMTGGGLANSPGVIIAFQIIWGIAGGILLPISQALLVNIFPDEKKSMAMGIWACGNGIAIAVGPLIGGVILNYLSWRWIFLVNLPFIAMGFFLTLLYAKESKAEGESTKIDWSGVFILKVAIAAFVLATVQSDLWRRPIIMSLYLLSAGALFFLLRVEKKAEMPVIREDLFKNRNFLLCCLGGFCTIGVFWSCIFLLPLYIQKQMHYSPLHAGVMLLGFALPIALLSPLSGHLYNKVAPNKLIAFGFLLLLLSSVMQLQFGEHPHPYFMALAIIFLGIGFSLIMTPTLTKAISTISRNHSGVASGTFVTMQEIGGSVGLAITVAIVRKQSAFSHGFHNGIWVVLILSLIGMGAALLLDRREKN